MYNKIETNTNKLLIGKKFGKINPAMFKGADRKLLKDSKINSPASVLKVLKINFTIDSRY